jgi:hypothetical protein
MCPSMPVTTSDVAAETKVTLLRFFVKVCLSEGFRNAVFII